jgi:hypothetical protein
MLSFKKIEEIRKIFMCLTNTVIMKIILDTFDISLVADALLNFLKQHHIVQVTLESFSPEDADNAPEEDLVGDGYVRKCISLGSLKEEMTNRYECDSDFSCVVPTLKVDFGYDGSTFWVEYPEQFSAEMAALQDLQGVV